MSRRLLGGLVVAGLLTVTACGSDTSTETDAETTESSSPGGEAGSTSSKEPTTDDDVLAGVIAGNPTDVRWRFGTVPPSWQSLKTEEGIAQWQVGDACILTMYQPAGLGDGEEPTQEQVLEKFTADIEAGVGMPLEIGDKGTRMFPVITEGDAEISTRMNRAHLTGADGVEGSIYAYRSGDFALVLSTLCAEGNFATVNESEFEPFIEQVTVAAKY